MVSHRPKQPKFKPLLQQFKSRQSKKGKYWSKFESIDDILGDDIIAADASKADVEMLDLEDEDAEEYQSSMEDDVEMYDRREKSQEKPKAVPSLNLGGALGQSKVPALGLGGMKAPPMGVGKLNLGAINNAPPVQEEEVKVQVVQQKKPMGFSLDIGKTKTQQ